MSKSHFLHKSFPHVLPSALLTLLSFSMAAADDPEILMTDYYMTSFKMGRNWSLFVWYKTVAFIIYCTYIFSFHIDYGINKMLMVNIC